MNDIQTKNFKGLSLHPYDTFKNIASFIEVAGLLTIVTDEEYQELGDVILELTQKYAKAAQEIASGETQMKDRLKTLKEAAMENKNE
ncbi:TPA_asm: hypothetical protein G0G78_12075 [Salmonella enterica]|nr:hypothetical protein [Salmonella enterica]HAC8271041.1 hypothetical protein [Salmonella enterica]